VIVNGRRINSCLTLAVMHDGAQVTTIEGLGTPKNMHPMQTAFVKHDGYQCGYCTLARSARPWACSTRFGAAYPAMSAPTSRHVPLLSAEELRERMSGNICRCGAYPNIIDAITEVAGSSAA
jgi:xanthine dehydrogenase YagT iron-sulfur-binding subunit